MTGTNGKKVLAFLVSFIILLTIGGAANATADTTQTGSIYKVSQMDMTLTLPNNMLAVTRDSASNDQFFSTFNEVYSEVMNAFKESDIYLKGVTSDGVFSVIVTMTTDKSSQEIYNYNQLGATELDTIQDAFLQDDIYTDCSKDVYNDWVFLNLIIDYEKDGQQYHAAQSNTVVNGMNINFTFQSANGKLTPDDYQVITSMLRSLEFADGEDRQNEQGFVGSAGFWVLMGGIVVVLAAAGFAVYKFVIDPHRKNSKVLNSLNEDYGNSWGTQRRPAAKRKTSGKGEQGTVQGYRSSSDYFDEMFEPREDRQESREHAIQRKRRRQEVDFEEYDTFGYVEDSPSGFKKITGTLGSFFRHLGYFFQNLFRLITRRKPKKGRRGGSQKPSNSKERSGYNKKENKNEYINRKW